MNAIIAHYIVSLLLLKVDHDSSAGMVGGGTTQGLAERLLLKGDLLGDGRAGALEGRCAPGLGPERRVVLRHHVGVLAVSAPAELAPEDTAE